jgi:hypothetical protein
MVPGNVTPERNGPNRMLLLYAAISAISSTISTISISTSISVRPPVPRALNFRSV